MDALRFSRAAKQHLEKEERVLTDLLACLEEERVALTSLDGPQVMRIASRKESLAAEEQLLAEARRALINEAAAAVSEQSGGSAVDLSLGEILERLRPPGAGALSALRTRVRTMAAQAQRMNAVNRQLCTHALSCVRGYLHLAGRTSSDTYGATGRLVSVAAQGGGYARRA
jgi:flagellar biosynthesis/type III secretory pathway chaperone